MSALIGAGLFNPMSIEILDQYFKWVYSGIAVVCAAWIVGFILYSAFRPTKLQIPSKTKKPKHGLKYELT